MILVILGIIAGIIVFGLGIFSTVSVIRNQGRKAQKSAVSRELFYKITRYKASIYIVHLEQPKDLKAVVYGDANDYAELLDVLKTQFRFPAPTAKEAAKYAVKESHDQPLEEKIRVALQYLGTDKNAEIQG